MIAGKVSYEHPNEFIDEFGRNKLHYAANNGVVLVVKKLLDDGIDIDAQDNNGWTALHFASQNNHFKVINLLLENKANPNIHDKQGNGPLWTASMHAKGNCHGVLLLLKAGADPKHKNKYGRTPFYIAETSKNELIEVFTQYTK